MDGIQTNVFYMNLFKNMGLKMLSFRTEVFQMIELTETNGIITQMRLKKENTLILIY
jgi:hypothetical protein